MDIDAQKVIEILGRRIAAEVIANAVKEAALMNLQESEAEGEKAEGPS